MNIPINNNQTGLNKNMVYINSIVHPKGGYVAIPQNLGEGTTHDSITMFIARTRGFGHVSLPGIYTR